MRARRRRRGSARGLDWSCPPRGANECSHRADVVTMMTEHEAGGKTVAQAAAAEAMAMLLLLLLPLPPMVVVAENV